VIYEKLKDKNFEIVSVAQDTNGVKDAGPWITAAKPTYTALIDEKHEVSKLYNMVNVPTGVWIDEQGRIVRPNEVAFVDDRFKTFSGLDSEPYLTALKDWVEKGSKSAYAMSEERLREKLAVGNPEFAMAAAEFGLGEYLYKAGRGAEAIPHFKEAQRLNPKSWSYKRQAYALSAEKDYGTTFREEVQKAGGSKTVYAAPDMAEYKKGTAGGAQNGGPERKVAGTVITSEREPAARITLPATTQYVGADRWVLYDVADCEIQVFVEADAEKKVKRLYWVQFEGYVPTRPELRHEYDSPRHAKLGGLDFFVDTWVRPSDAPTKPGSDREHVTMLLWSKGYTLPAGMMDVRLVHLLDESTRKELMIIYGEDVSATGFTAAELNEDGKAPAKWAEIEKGLIERAKQKVGILALH
jgi:tetratricopeptide (TPR) repeat protein